MKIDFINSSLVGGGAERVLVLLANAFDSKGYNVRIITFNPPEDFDFNKSIKRVRLHEGKIIPNHTVRSFILLSKFYFNKNNRPDIIFSFQTLNSFFSIPVARMYSIKIIAAEHTNHLRNSQAVNLSLFTKKHLYKKANLLTVLTYFDFKYYENFDVNVKVIPNPCSFKPIDNNNHEREKVILAIGNLDRFHIKGFDNLMLIVAPILKSNPSWKLKIIGKGDLDIQLFLKNKIVDSSVKSQIVFVGFTSNVSEIMKKSSIFILTSRYEGLPMVLIEAMSQGMACISYDCISGPSDIIENNVNGILIENQNQLKMKEGLDELIKDKEKRKSLAEKGIKSLNKFKIENIIEEYNKIFNDL